MPQPGLYEQVINSALNREPAEIPAVRKSVAPIDRAEATKALAQYLADVVQKGLGFCVSIDHAEFMCRYFNEHGIPSNFDYFINESLFLWQSQSPTAADSPTGQRYIHHRERGSKVLLFVRELKSDRITGGAAAYTFLGTANYVKHDGCRPMNIAWRLDRPVPAKFLKKTNQLIVG